MAVAEHVQEQRILLRNISWETFEQLLEARGEARSPRYTYYRGELEVTSPILAEHGESDDNARFLVHILLSEWAIDVRGFGPLTLRREGIRGSVEPDGSFYIQSEERIRGRVLLDLGVDPPPDLVIEVEMTNPLLPKFPIYAQLGVPELWRYRRRRIEIYVLEGDRYVLSTQSSLLRGVTADALSELLTAKGSMGSTAWERRVREWARGLRGDATT